jgi:hypothetical protein
MSTDYNRPDFHPDDRDTTELVERWRTTRFGEEGSLADRLKSRGGGSGDEAAAEAG